LILQDSKALCFLDGTQGFSSYYFIMKENQISKNEFIKTSCDKETSRLKRYFNYF